jgi:hypothetical protein
MTKRRERTMKNENMENNEALALVEAQESAVAERNMTELMEELEGLGDISFDKIKIPSGGGIAFEFPTDDPDAPESRNAIEGVIVHHQPKNVYYRDAYNGENNQPDCASHDGKTGVRTATGAVADCSKCRYNQFGSAGSGQGKACQNRMDLYILTEDSMFPVILNLPATSLKAFKEYLAKRVVFQKKKLCEVKTKITLKKEKSSGGITYSKCCFAKIGDLGPVELSEAETMREMCRGYATSTAAQESQEEPLVELQEEDDDLPFEA